MVVQFNIFFGLRLCSYMACCFGPHYIYHIMEYCNTNYVLPCSLLPHCFQQKNSSDASFITWYISLAICEAAVIDNLAYFFICIITCAHKYSKFKYGKENSDISYLIRLNMLYV